MELDDPSVSLLPTQMDLDHQQLSLSPTPSIICPGNLDTLKPSIEFRLEQHDTLDQILEVLMTSGLDIS